MRTRVSLRRAAKAALALYGAYVLLACTLPFMNPPAVDDGAAHTLTTAQYTADSTGPDRALLVESTTDALSLRLQMLHSAEESLDIVYHAVHDGESTRAFLGEVLMAADRGVAVRLLVDGTTDLIAGRARTALRTVGSHENISLRLYNAPDALKPAAWNALLHDKFILMDGRLLLLGGRNLGDAYFAPAGYEKNVTNDRDVLVWQAGGAEGSGMEEVAAYMQLLWEAPETKPVNAQGGGAAAMAALKEEAAAFREENPRFYQQTLAEYLAATLETNRVSLLYNPVEHGAKAPWVGYAIGDLMAGATGEVVLQTPYATANSGFLDALEATAASVEVTMLTNSLASSPNFPAYSNYNAARERFAATGASVYEYQSTDSIHGKSLVIDGHLALVGSFNMDDRSLHLDTESMLVIDSEPFARSLLEAIEGYIGSSLQVAPDGGYLPGAVAELAPGTGKRVLMVLAALISIPFQYLI